MTMHPLNRFLGFSLTVSLGVLCYASSAIGQQNSTTQSTLNKNPLFPYKPMQPVANGPVLPDSPAQKRGLVESSEPVPPLPSGASAPSIDPFQNSDDPPPPRRRSSPMGSDPFDPILSAVGRTLNEPIPYASLPTGELAKAEEKIREMRIAVLKNAIEMASARLNYGDGSDPLSPLGVYAELIEELTTLEFQKAQSSGAPGSYPKGNRGTEILRKGC